MEVKGRIVGEKGWCVYHRSMCRTFCDFSFVCSMLVLELHTQDINHHSVFTLMPIILSDKVRHMAH